MSGVPMRGGLLRAAQMPLPPGPRKAQPDAEREQVAAGRLLKRLAEPGMLTERQPNSIQLLRREGANLRVVGTCPPGALASLVISGAVHCTMNAGRPRFHISDAGRSALFRRECRQRDLAEDQPFSRQHRVMADSTLDVAGVATRLRVNLRDNPLALLARQRDGFARNFIGAAAIQAGERLARDMELGQIEPKMGINWQAVAVDSGGYGGQLSLPEIAMEARQRARRALVAVGPDHAGLLMDLCGFSKGLEQIERERGLPARSGKVWVGLALRALALHYGLADEARGPDRTAMRSARYSSEARGDMPAE